MRKLCFLLICLAVVVSGCASPTTPSPAPSVNSTPAASVSSTPAPSASSAASPSNAASVPVVTPAADTTDTTDTSIVSSVTDTPDATTTDTPNVTAATPSSTTLDGSAWVLQKLQGKPLTEGTNITLKFAKGRVTGYAGCNAYNGTYTNGKANALTVSGITATQRKCSDQEGVDQQEATYLKTLSDLQTYQIAGNNLEIRTAAGDTQLSFTPRQRFAANPAALVSTQWQLRSFNGQDLPAGALYTLNFTSPHDASGSTGCQRYLATYEAEGDELRFTNTDTPSVDCMRPRSQGQEIDFVSSFTFGMQYRLSPDRLEMFPAEGGTLVWGPLKEADMAKKITVWTLQGFLENGITTPPTNGVTMTLQFDDDTLRPQGTLSGSAGCNTYHGGYTYKDTFTISPLATTRKACPPAVMDGERRFLDLLQKVRTYRLDEQLVLQTQDGRGLVFVVQ